MPSKKKRQRHPLYATWRGVMQRCFNKNHRGYRNYGALGVTVCPHWKHSKAFVADMSPKPEGTTLGRFLDLGNYSCPLCDGNAIWMTQKQQEDEQRKKKALLQVAA